MYGYQLRFAPRVAEVMRTLSEAEQDELERIFGHIQVDPVPDPAAKVVIMVPPAVFTVHYASAFWVVYHVVGAEIRVVNVGRARVLPSYR